jgi:carboxyl-terminal processing protease
MKYLQRYALPVLIVVSIFFAGWVFGHRNGRQLTEGQINFLIGSHMNDKLTKVVSYIGSDYIEPISQDSLAELAIPAILEKLDPHSAYLPAREFKQVEEPLQGEFDGIGVVAHLRVREGATAVEPAR